MREAIRARTALATLLMASVLLVMLDVRDGGAISGIRGFVAAVVGPVERAAGAVASPLVSIAQGIWGFSDADHRQAEVGADLRALMNGPDAARLGQAERLQVEGLLRAASLAQYRVVPARVVAYGSVQRFTSSVTLDAGSASGVSPDMSVITGDGLVGRVVSVGPTTATVELISDPQVVVGVRAGGAMQAGAVDGEGGPGELVLQMLDITAALGEGDRVVTFGSAEGRPYPPGIPVGTVSGFRGDPGQADRVALVRPTVSLTSLDIVGVVIEAPQSDVRAAVLPPAPSAAQGAGPNPSAGGR